MQENPVFNREVRGRWRRSLTPVAFFAYSVVLALAAYFDYYSCMEIMRYSAEANGRESRAGQDLFMGMASVQVILVSLFATAVTAPSMSCERESGTLYILRFAPVTMRSVVFGKLQAAVLLVLLLIFVPLPVISLSFVLGGVSAGEFCAAVGIQLASGIVCASIGMLCSALSPTASRALPAAFMLSICTLPVPTGLISNIGERDFFIWWIFGLAGAAFVAYLCLRAAVARLESEPAETSIIRQPAFTSAGLEVYGALLSEEGSYAPLAAPPLVPGGADSPYFTARLRRRSLLTPIGRALTFANPVFQHQIRRHLDIIARAPARELQARAIQLSAAFIGWLAWWVLTFFHPDVTTPFAEVLPWMRFIGYGMVIFATANAAVTFARERSQNMLNSLLLSPLSPRAVAGAKRDAALVAAVFYFLVASPFFSFAFALNFAEAASQAVLFVTLMALGSSLGVLSGWLCRSQGMAVAIALIALVAFHVAFLAVRESFEYSAQYYPAELLQRPWGNFIFQLIQPANPMELLQARLVFLTSVLGVSALAMLPVVWGLRPKALEKDRASWLNQDLSKMV